LPTRRAADAAEEGEGGRREGGQGWGGQRQGQGCPRDLINVSASLAYRPKYRRGKGGREVGREGGRGGAGRGVGGRDGEYVRLARALRMPRIRDFASDENAMCARANND